MDSILSRYPWPRFDVHIYLSLSLSLSLAAEKFDGSSTREKNTRTEMMRREDAKTALSLKRVYRINLNDFSTIFPRVNGINNYIDNANGK